MRLARIKVHGRSAVYHCISRVVGGQALLDDLGKEKLTQILGQLSQFCGIEVITYCMMSNHFHILIRVPEKQELTDVELVERMEALYGKEGTLVVLARKALAHRGVIDADIRESMLERMGDVSSFMKELKQRFSRWYNRQAVRFGTLWAERFKSVLVEDQPNAVETVAAYIDLNPVRAGLVQDPKDYRFCGYAEALAGNKTAQSGLKSFHKSQEWNEVAAEYRMRLFVGAGVSGRSQKAVLDRETIQAVLKAGGKLSMGQILRLRIRHMTDGVVLGSQGFVNEVFAQHREKFGKNRKDGARPIRGVPLGLSALRDLRLNAVG
jgi:REP element-mobilizing transposase RayT